MTHNKPRSRSDLGPGGRVIAVLLSIVWLTGGMLAIALGVCRENWIALLLGITAVVYGVVWAQVARTGQRFQWPARHR